MAQTPFATRNGSAWLPRNRHERLLGRVALTLILAAGALFVLGTCDPPTEEANPSEPFLWTACIPPAVMQSYIESGVVQGRIVNVACR